MRPKTITQVTIWLAAMAVLAAVSLAEALLRSWAVLLAGAALALGAYAIGRRHGARRMAGRAITAELRHDALRRQVDDVSKPTRPVLPADPGARDRLLSDRLSGVRELFGDDR